MKLKLLILALLICPANAPPLSKPITAECSYFQEMNRCKGHVFTVNGESASELLTIDIKSNDRTLASVTQTTTNEIKISPKDKFTEGNITNHTHGFLRTVVCGQSHDDEFFCTFTYQTKDKVEVFSKPFTENKNGQSKETESPAVEKISFEDNSIIIGLLIVIVILLLAVCVICILGFRYIKKSVGQEVISKLTASQNQDKALNKKMNQALNTIITQMSEDQKALNTKIAQMSEDQKALDIKITQMSEDQKVLDNKISKNTASKDQVETLNKKMTQMSKDQKALDTKITQMSEDQKICKDKVSKDQVEALNKKMTQMSEDQKALDTKIMQMSEDQKVLDNKISKNTASKDQVEALNKKMAQMYKVLYQLGDKSISTNTPSRQITQKLNENNSHEIQELMMSRFGENKTIRYKYESQKKPVMENQKGLNSQFEQNCTGTQNLYTSDKIKKKEMTGSEVIPLVNIQSTYPPGVMETGIHENSFKVVKKLTNMSEESGKEPAPRQKAEKKISRNEDRSKTNTKIASIVSIKPDSQSAPEQRRDMKEDIPRDGNHQSATSATTNLLSTVVKPASQEATSEVSCSTPLMMTNNRAENDYK